MNNSKSPYGDLPTIVAQATPPGISALAIVRLTGYKTLEIISSITHKPVSSFSPGHTLLSGIYNTSNQLLDRVIITYYKSPNSYTGEDVVDISCHGGLSTPKSIVSACLDVGAAPAPPGEFTKRAFLNGKMDLAQAEAVADIIKAKTEKSQRIGAAALSGKLSSEITTIRNDLISIIGHMEAELDFLDEEIQPVRRSDWVSNISQLKQKLSSLLNTFSAGHIFRDGALVVIGGMPNVGKSSLLNAFLQEDRVIVSKEPGTTRDSIDVLYEIDGVPIRFADTAGIRVSDSPVEALGVEVAHNMLRSADLVLWVWSALTPTEYLINSISNPPFSSPFLVVMNKADLLTPNNQLLNIEKQHLFVSAKTGQNISLLLSNIKTLLASDVTSDQLLLTNKRHETVVRKTIFSLNEVLLSLDNNETSEVLLADLRVALSQLDAIVGITTPDDILSSIFDNFCVGK